MMMQHGYLPPGRITRGMQQLIGQIQLRVFDYPDIPQVRLFGRHRARAEADHCDHALIRRHLLVRYDLVWLTVQIVGAARRV